MSKEQQEFEWVKKYAELRSGAVWKLSLEKKDGKRLGEKLVKNVSNSVRGYCQVLLNNKPILYHRIVVMLHYDRPIKKGYVVDHIDGDKLNNCISNLREVLQSENCQNKEKHRRGYLVGTSYNKTSDKWRASIWVSGKNIHLGYFDTQLQAYDAYVKKWCEVYDAA